jgi:hypothetical protein
MSWEYEFALPFINNGHFYVTDPGPLRAPVNDFSIRRNEGLTLVIETRCPSDAKSIEPERPPGTVRLSVESAELENIGGIKAKLQGVIPYRFRRTDNYRTGDGELTEEAQIHEISAVVPDGGEARYTIDWVKNLPTRPFLWPASIDTKTETLTTRKIGIGGNEIELFSKEISHSGANHAAQITVGGMDIYICALERKDGGELKKPGCILYDGIPDDQFRKKVRTAVSLALSVYLVELGSAVYRKDWEVVSFKARSPYIPGNVLDLPILPPAPMNIRRRRELGSLALARLVNAVFDKYEAFDLGNLSWAYWHALCATPHIASVHFGAAVEMLLRQYAATKPLQFSQGIITDGVIWSSFSAQVDEVVSKLEIPDAQKSALRKNIGGLNRVHHRDIMEAILKDIRIALGADEIQAWKRRNDAAHGIAMAEGEELDVIRDIKLLKVMFHRMLLRMLNGADYYIDYATPGFPIRGLAEPVPPAPGR